MASIYNEYSDDSLTIITLTQIMLTQNIQQLQTYCIFTAKKNKKSR